MSEHGQQIDPRWIEIRNALTMIGALHRGFIPSQRVERQALERVWHLILDEVPTGQVLPLVEEAIREAHWQPSPHDIVERWRRRAMPLAAPDVAAEWIIDAACAASWMDPRERQREVMLERLATNFDCRVIEPMLEVALEMRATIRTASQSSRPATLAAVRRAYEAACQQAIVRERRKGGLLDATQVARLVGDTATGN